MCPEPMVEVSFFNNFALSEHMKVQFGTEFFNFPDTPQFSDPDNSFGNPGFGTISSDLHVPTCIDSLPRLVLKEKRR